MLGVREQPGHRRLVGDEDTQVVGVGRDEEQRVDGSAGRRERIDRSAAQGYHQRMQVVRMLLGRDRGRRVLAQTAPGVAGIDEHQHPVGQETASVPKPVLSMGEPNSSSGGRSESRRRGRRSPRTRRWPPGRRGGHGSGERRSWIQASAADIRARTVRNPSYRGSMTDFTEQDLSGSTFRRVRLADALLQDVDLSRTRVRAAYLDGVRMTGVEVPDLEIYGELGRLVVNGVDVVPLVEAELDRRMPERALMRPTDAEGFRTAFATLDRLWAGTLDRARALPPRRCTSRSTRSGRSSRPCATSGSRTPAGWAAWCWRPVALAPPRPAVGRGADRRRGAVGPGRAARRSTRCSRSAPSVVRPWPACSTGSPTRARPRRSRRRRRSSRTRRA